MDNVASFVYLRSNVEGGRHTTSEIDHRLAIASTALHDHRGVFSARSLTLGPKIDAYQMYVVESALHGHEGWSFHRGG